MAVNWLYFTSIGSVLIIFALFLSSNGILGADTLRVILLNFFGGALLTAGSIGNALGEDGEQFYPFIVLNSIFSLIAAAAFVRNRCTDSNPHTVDEKMAGNDKMVVDTGLKKKTLVSVPISSIFATPV